MRINVSKAVSVRNFVLFVSIKWWLFVKSQQIIPNSLILEGEPTFWFV